MKDSARHDSQYVWTRVSGDSGIRNRRTEIVKESPIIMTDRAADEIRRIIATKEIPEDYALRVGVRGGGCSGMSYILGFDRHRDQDLQFELDGISILMDKRHGLYLMGTTLDYQDGLDARGFTFDNPNATATCGCGSSFAA
jgi:iron-sulfur cluster assembly protein